MSLTNLKLCTASDEGSCEAACRGDNAKVLSTHEEITQVMRMTRPLKWQASSSASLDFVFG